MQRHSSLISLSWIVFVHALLVSFESIAIEQLTVNQGIAPLPFSAISITIAGGVFMTAVVIRQRSARQYFEILTGSWKPLLTGSILIAVALIAWYDSVSRIGASKEALLAGPLETAVIVVLARSILSEKLIPVQMIGVVIALGGFFAAVASGAPSVSGTSWFSFGDLEAIISALAFGSGIIIVTPLAERYSPAITTAPLLLISGVILFIGLPFVNLSSITPSSLGWIALFSVLPLGAAYTYVVGLGRIGASLTSTIASFSIVIVLAVQMITHTIGYEALLPDNIPLAVIGGILGVLGIYLMHRSSRTANVGFSTRQPI